MAIKLVQSQLVAILEGIKAANTPLTIRLHKFNAESPPAYPSTYYEEADFPGYAAVELVETQAPFWYDAVGRAQWRFSRVTFTADHLIAYHSIGGYHVTRPDGSVVWSEAFRSPRTITTDGEVLIIDPLLQVWNN